MTGLLTLTGERLCTSRGGWPPWSCWNERYCLWAQARPFCKNCLSSQFEMQKMGFLRGRARHGRQNQNETNWSHNNLKSIQGRCGDQDGRLPSPHGCKQRDARGLRSSCRAASRAWAGPGGGGAGPSQEGCRTQRANWNAFSCCHHRLPLYRLKKPLKSSARL